ncbi:MAG: hypothetical protein KUG77_17025 [Nannocystaceae bacterium]|nr:hypothetical protein [Nannocystaceae bacterium]
MIKRELRSALSEQTPQADRAINYASERIAGQVEDICRGLPSNVRAAGVVVAAAGVVYGVSQMPEEEIRAAISRIRADVIDRRITIAGQQVKLTLSTDLAPIFGERATVNAEARWRQQLFGTTGIAKVFANDIGGNGLLGASYSAPLDNGRMEFGANSQDGGTLYFRIDLEF